MKQILCLILCVVLMLPCAGVTVSAAEENLSIIPSIAAYHVTGTVLADDGYIGIPVEINTYMNGASTSESQIILYVVNTNTERIGLESDDTILTDLLGEGYIVVVLDYKNDPKAVTPDLDWSVQQIRTSIDKTGAYLNGSAYKAGYNYILPAGYRIERDVYYWSIDKHGSDGCLDNIVHVWNNDFTERKGNSVITYPDGRTCKVKDIVAQSIDDCVKPDGTPLDMDLRLDIIYPSQPANQVPVMFLASSAETRIESWTTPLRPHLTGYLFSGYAGVVYDHAYVPMARDDHYGYYDGTVSGNAFTLIQYTGVKAQTAAVRRLRYLADKEPDKYKFDGNRYGAYGHSKGSWNYLLGLPHPELQEEKHYLSGHHGETAPGVQQPWLTYESSGEAIPSNVQMVYVSNGDATDLIGEGMAPTFTSVGEEDGDGMMTFLPTMVNNSRIYDVPCMYYTMPGVGHTIIYGYNEKYDVDMYQALFDFSNYYLKDDSAICEYITPLNGTREFDVKDKITLKFTGPVAGNEIESKVAITNRRTGEAASGTWQSDLGDTTWEFTGHNLKGGYEYLVEVPQTVLAQNGKQLKAAKSAVFKTKYESMVCAGGVYSDAGDMTLTKTAADENGVYFVFDPQDFAKSTTTALRFSVENEAANSVLIYAIDALDDADITNSTVGAQIGEIKLTGKGDYEIDVTGYVNALGEGGKAAFLLRAGKNVQNITVTDIDFEAPDSRIPQGSVSSEQNNTENGQNSYKDTMLEIRRLIVGDRYITDEDLGRRFHISFDLLTPTQRLITAKVRNFAPSGSKYADWRDDTYKAFQPVVNRWNKVDMDYVINDPAYIANKKDCLSIRKSGMTFGGPTEYLYIDNLKVTESVTGVKIAGAASAAAFAPSLVLHPADKSVPVALNAAYVESGENSGASFEDSDPLLISGREAGMGAGEYKKAYARIALDGYSGAQAANVKINVTGESAGKLYVYGVADPAAAAGWNADTIHYMNAPANDRFSFDADKSKVYGGAPAACLDVSGPGEYAVDVTEYAAYMKDQGAAFGTLIFVQSSPSKPEREILTESFDGSSVPFEIIQGGDIISHGLSANESRSGSSSYMMNTAYDYDRLKFDILDCRTLSTADVGKRFTVTYWMKSDKTGSFFNSLLFRRGANEHVQRQTQSYTTANEWQQLRYSFTLTADMITESSTAETIPSYLNFQLDRMGGRASGKTENVCVYIDDLTVTENGVGDIQFSFVAGDAPAAKYKKTISFDDLASWRIGGSPRKEVNDEFDMGLGGIALADLPAGLAGSVVTEGDAHATPDHTTGTGKSLWINPPGSSNRFKFYNLFDHNLTTADLGRTFRISFWGKTTSNPGRFACGLMSVGSGSSYSAGFYESALNKSKPINPISNTWQLYTYDITVDEGMLASHYIGHENDYYNPALFSIVSDGLNGRQVYIDDMVIEETTASEQPYSFRYDWDAGTAEEPWSFNGYEDGPGKVLVSAEENHTAGDSKAKSLKVLTDKTYNRVYFYHVIDQLTAEDVGRNFQISLWVKADREGTFQLTMTNKSAAGAEYPGEVRQSNKIAKEDVGRWVKYTYAFTVSEGMAAAEANLLGMYLSGFGQNSAGTVKTNLYIDDLSSIERTEGPAVSLSVDQAASVSNVALGNPAAIVAGRKDSVQRIRKAYLQFAGGDYETAQKATLDLPVIQANGQKIKVYGLINQAYPSPLTYDNAPASREDESMDIKSVYLGAPLAEIVAGTGVQRIDVTDYVKAQGTKNCLFAITTGEGGDLDYAELDFEAFPFSEGIDYTAFGGYRGNVSQKEGAALVEGIAGTGQGIRLLNVFGGDNAVCKAGETYTVSADVTPLGTDENGYEMTLGLCGKNGSGLSQDIRVSETIAANGTKKMTFTFTADARNVSDGACALAVYCSSSNPAQGFRLDNVSVKSGNSVAIRPGASLTVQKAQEPDDVPPASGVSIQSFHAASGTAVIQADATRTATVIFAGYNGNQLAAVKIIEVALKQGRNEVVAEGFDTTGVTGGEIMVWSDLGKLSPLCRAYKF